MPTAIQVLSKYWGYDEFRPLQDEIIASVIAGKDVLALMPTGGGKSICFQIPALMQDGICIVISPLIALMKDQVQQLVKRGIKAEAIYSGMHFREVEDTLNRCVFGGVKLLYISPERLGTESFRERLFQMNVSMIAVDEAHCISQWGYDFRPAYLQIPKIKEWVGDHIPFIALTATATPFVKEDILDKLELKEAVVYVKSFERENLSYSLRYVEDKLGRLLNIFQGSQETGIVYVRSRRGTEQIAEFLQKNGLSADFYHAGLASDERSQKQQDWIDDKIQIMSCTNAFGMGIDKADVRTVVHINLPESLEEYYQEAGRAGRDGTAAEAILLYKEGDGERLIKNFEQSMPTLAMVREVYHALGNYLGIAYEAGFGQSIDYDLVKFAGTYKISVIQVYNALRILAQESYISLTEGFLRPSKVFIRLDRPQLEYFLDYNVEYEPILKSILRTYEGIMDEFRYIKEEQIAQMIGKTVSEVLLELEKLQQFDVLLFEARSDSPKVSFLTPRLTKENLRLDAEKYLFRRNVRRNNIQAMIDFAEKREVCRSRMLLKYFGEEAGKDCGVCDYCLHHPSKQQLDQTAKWTFRNQIKELLQNAPSNFEQLVANFHESDTEESIALIRQMMEEGEIQLGDNDLLYWHKI